MRYPRLVAAVLAVVLGAVLSACGGLPTGSSVQQGSQVGEPAAQPVRVQPDGPSNGATPDQIVRGFLRAGAGAGFDDDHAIARSFFTQNVKDSWLPDSGVEVYGDDSALTIELVTPTTVQVTASIVARIDSAGRYQQMTAGTSSKATFELQEVAAGWRISVPQKGFGLWLSASDLDRIYRPFTIAYVSKSARTIVEDRRWFPITPGLATTLARAQLAPVPAYLGGAVLTGVPTGTALAVDAVPIQSGLAVVDLSASALSADPNLRRAMWAQFVTTLLQVPSVTQVSLQVEGARLDLAGTPVGVSLLTTLDYESSSSVSVPTAVLRSGDELTRVPSDQPQNPDRPGKAAQVPPGSVLPKIPTGWASLALSWDSSEIAGIGASREDLGRWKGDRLFQLAPFATMLTKPSYDSLGGLWVAGQAGGAARVWVIDTSVSPVQNAKPRQILAPSLAKRTVLALRVAKDNQRVALITSDLTGKDVRVQVAGIVRSANGVAISLTAEPLRVGRALTSATDVTWVDDVTLAVVGRVRPTEGAGPFLVEIGGNLTQLSPLAGARLVTNTGGFRGLVVITDLGKVWTRAGNGWQELQTGTDFLIPGQ